ncbi:MAG: AI-2E family transporter [Chloroflexota bacterium]
MQAPQPDQGQQRETAYLRWRTSLVVILALLGGSYLFAQGYLLATRFGDVVNMYFSAWIVQFLLAPPVDWLCARGWRRAVAAATVYAAGLIILAALAIWLLPVLLTQIQDFISGKLAQIRLRDIPSITRELQRFVTRHAPKEAQGYLHQAIANGSSQLQSQLAGFSKPTLANVGGLTVKIAGGTVSLVQNTLGMLFSLLITLILSFLMMVQGRQAVKALRAYVPPSISPDVEAVLAVINRAFGGFIRGQLVLSSIYGALIWLILLVFAYFFGGSTDLAALSALAALASGIIMAIPLVGTTLSMIPPVLAGMVTLDGWLPVLWLFVLLWILQVVMANAVGPRVISDSVGVNPVWSFAALLIGAKLGGILGALFAVPLFAVGLAVADRVYWHMIPGVQRPIPEVIDDDKVARRKARLAWGRRVLRERKLRAERRPAKPKTTDPA